MHAPSSRALAVIATSAIVAFVTNVALLPLVQSGDYNAVHQTISELALGRAGWLQDAAFCLFGVGTACLALVVRRQTGARFSPTALALAAGLDVVSASFHAVRTGSPATYDSKIHVAAGIATFVLTIAAMYGLVRPLRRSTAWAGHARPTQLWALVATIAMVALGPPNTGYYFGLGQRAMAATFVSWMLATAIKARAVGESTPSTPALAVTAPEGFLAS